MSKEKMITTISGKKCKVSDCKLIKGDYYLIGDINIEHSGDCYYMESSGKYVRFTSELLIYDHTVKQYVYQNNKTLLKGVVGIDENGVLQKGHFTYKRQYLLPVVIEKTTRNKFYAVNDSIFKGQNFYKENLKDGVYRSISDEKAINFTKKVVCPYDIKKNLSYSVTSDAIKTATTSHKEGFDFPNSPLVEKFGDFVDKYTFGLEFETIKGFVPNRICKKLGLIPVRDGSIESLEYVTIPLKGKKGLETVMQTAKELDKRTEYNDTCSLHLHIGGIPRTESYFLALYRLLFFLQDEMYSMFPIYKQDNRGYKKKHYTKPINFRDALIHMDKSIGPKNITENFNHLFKFLSAGRSYDNYDSKLRNVESHPSDPNGTSKWNINSRYYWVNLIPLLFGNKKTVEFRVHTATHDYRKIFAFMNYCISIVKYAEGHQEDILLNPSNYANIRLGNLLYDSIENDRLVQYLESYIRDRKNFIRHNIKNKNLSPCDKTGYFPSLSHIVNLAMKNDTKSLFQKYQVISDMMHNPNINLDTANVAAGTLINNEDNE